MNTKKFISLIIWLSFAWLNCAQQQQYMVLNTPFQVIDNLGNHRNYTVFLPSAGERMPLLVYFHGVMSAEFKNKAVLKNYSGSPVRETGLIEFCKNNQIILLSLIPRYSYKNLGCTAKGWSPFSKEINGVEKVIDIVLDQYPVNKKEVFLVGISAGAVLCHHLAHRRPAMYKAILSHSQAYISEDNSLLIPARPGPSFGVLFCYTKGDYKNLISLCIKSEQIYRNKGYRTKLIKNLPPLDHSWSATSNRRFWRYLNNLGSN